MKKSHGKSFHRQALTKVTALTSNVEMAPLPMLLPKKANSILSPLAKIQIRSLLHVIN